MLDLPSLCVLFFTGRRKCRHRRNRPWRIEICQFAEERIETLFLRRPVDLNTLSWVHISSLDEYMLPEDLTAWGNSEVYPGWEYNLAIKGASFQPYHRHWYWARNIQTACLVWKPGSPRWSTRAYKVNDMIRWWKTRTSTIRGLLKVVFAEVSSDSMAISTSVRSGGAGSNLRRLKSPNWRRAIW